MIGLDTNVLLRWLVADDLVGPSGTEHAQALKSLLETDGNVFFINEIVVVEIVWVLKQRAKLSKPQIAGVINALLNLEKAVVKDREILAAALRSYTAYPGDFSDHLIAEINMRAGCRTTMTFDKAAARSPHFTELTR